MIPTSSMIETYTGIYIDLYDPQPSHINITDIGYALSHIGRFTGHTDRFYSVAEHAILCAKRALNLGYENYIALMALHHDSSEAYLGDVSRPLKHLLGDVYRDLEEKMMRRIEQSLFLPWPTDSEKEIIKKIDDWALAVEAYFLIPSGGKGWYTEHLYNHDYPIPEVDRVASELPKSEDIAKEFIELHTTLRRESGWVDEIYL